MRPLIALFLLAFSLFPEIASAKKKPPKIIPKSYTIHKQAIAFRAVGINCMRHLLPRACNAFGSTVKAFLYVKLGTNVTRCSETTNPQSFDIKVSCASGLGTGMLAVAIDGTGVPGDATVILIAETTYKGSPMLDKKFSEFQPDGVYTFGESQKDNAEDAALEFVRVCERIAAKEGIKPRPPALVAKECAESRAALGLAAQDDDGRWRRLRKLCREYGLK